MLGWDSVSLVPWAQPPPCTRRAAALSEGHVVKSHFLSRLCLGLDIESSLKQLAERRTDIFGVEETAIGKKIGEEEIQKPEEKVQFVFS